MNLSYFMRERTKIIRLFYEEGRVPFEQLKRQIEDGVPPFEPPPFNPEYDDSEPPFLSEWIEAEQTRELVGMLAVSLLSDTLKLYFEELEREIGFEFISKKAREDHFKQGFVPAYKQILEHIMGDKFYSCGVRFDIIEQVILARNDLSHNGRLITFSTKHNRKTLEKHPNPFFANDDLRSEYSNKCVQWGGLPIEVSRDRLLEAITEVEKLADWIQENDYSILKWQRTPERDSD